MPPRPLPLYEEFKLAIGELVIGEQGVLVDMVLREVNQPGGSVPSSRRRLFSFRHLVAFTMLYGLPPAFFVRRITLFMGCRFLPRIDGVNAILGLSSLNSVLRHGFAPTRNLPWQHPDCCSGNGEFASVSAESSTVDVLRCSGANKRAVGDAQALETMWRSSMARSGRFFRIGPERFSMENGKQCDFTKRFQTSLFLERRLIHNDER